MQTEYNFKKTDTQLYERKVPAIKLPNEKNLKEYLNIGEKLGEGTYGTVLSVIDKCDSKVYALKIINKPQAGQINLANIIREISILKMVDHPHIVRLEKIYESPEKIFIQSEKCNADLALVAKRRRFKFKESEIKQIISELSSAVAYLHRNNIIHRDIKLENILLAENPKKSDDELYIKLIDFGLSIVKNVASYKDMLRGACGTLAYMAPEVLNRNTYSQQCDVWAIGVLMFLLLEGRFPYFAKDEKALAVLYNESDISNVEFKASPEAVHLVRKMLTKNPALRITAAEIMHNSWVAGNETSLVSGNVLDKMKQWRSELKLPVGEHCDWMIELPMSTQADTHPPLRELNSKIPAMHRPPDAIETYSLKKHSAGKVKPLQFNRDKTHEVSARQKAINIKDPNIGK